MNDDDVHGGYTCKEVEEFCDDAQGDLNMISEALSRRGYTVDCREHDVYHWVLRALDEPLLDVVKRRLKRKIRRMMR